MAKNKFASLLHRSTNKITVVLVYAVVEWILILLLLFNSLLSFLIIKYAEFFGVKPPCPWFPWMMGFQETKLGENGEVRLKCCSCGGVRLDHCDSTVFSSYLLLQAASSHWFSDVLERFQKQDWISCGDHIQQELSSASISDAEMKESEAGAGEEEEDGILLLKEKSGTVEEKEIPPQHLQFFLHYNENEADVSIDSPSTTSSNLDEADDQGPSQVKEEMVEVESHCMFKIQPPFQLELNEIEDDGVTSKLASVDSLNQFRRNLAFLEKWDSGSDEGVTSELEGDEGVSATVESLRSALRAERKTVQALYAELEEERSASAEAADQAMAMINRLQEEKAAMQTEAFQYQRMMEELSEYDYQEALQLMNELMIKREKEKQELEMELEVYRKKILHYETMEKSSSCSNINAEDYVGI